MGRRVTGRVQTVCLCSGKSAALVVTATVGVCGGRAVIGTTSSLLV
jgi:hypothetical protein